MTTDQKDGQATLQPIEAVVCIPTFRRPEWLVRTLTSVLGQVTDFRFAVVVVDNDAVQSEGAARARALLVESHVPHRVFVEANQGNVYAINRAFSEAQVVFPEATFILMIDDDEMAMPGWLAAIVAVANREQADIVGGPVRREFDVPVPGAVARHPLFASIEGETRPVDQIHGSGNCLIRRRVFEQLPSPPFDTRFNFLGGGDMEFFTRCKHAGFSAWWCEEALIYEFVPAERVSARFLTQRSIRTGSINYVIDRTYTPAPLVHVKNFVSLWLGLARSAVALAQTRSFLGASHPLLMSVGRVAASLGFLPQPYKANH